MPLSLEEIAARLKGRIPGRATGNETRLLISGIASLETAQAGEIAFVVSRKYERQALKTQASALIAGKLVPGVVLPTILVDDPSYAFSQLLSYFHPPKRFEGGIDSKAVIGKEVSLGEGASIGPLAVLEAGVSIGKCVRIGAGVFVGEGSVIGDGSLIYPNVTIRERSRIGKRVILQSGVVIGSDGFGFAFHKGQYHKIPQVGCVVIEDDVELGANVTVDRATLGETVIGRGTKVDNQVQIGHNVQIGHDTILVSQVGISGSVQIGHHATLAGQVGVSGHLSIGDEVVVGGQAGVTKDIAAKQVVSGFPAMPHKEWLKVQAALRHLPALRKELALLKTQMTKLEASPQEQKKHRQQEDNP